VFSHRELEGFARQDLQMLMGEGILRQTGNATETPDGLQVRSTSRGLFGVAADDEAYRAPVPLKEDDVRQYDVSVSKLIACLRRENELSGSSTPDGRRLYLVGERILPDQGHADVYFALANEDPDDFISLCRKVRPTSPRPVLMLVPRPVPLSAENLQLLRSWNVFIVDLATHLMNAHWKLPWNRILKQLQDPVESERQRSRDYCRIVTREGSLTAGKVQYDEAVAARDRYEMFIDGMTGEASCRHGKAKPRSAKLTTRERSILIDVIQAGKPIRPFSTKTGSSSASPAAACRLFEEARRKVDAKLGRYTYRAFRLHKSPTDKKLKAFEFAPPDDLQYCVIVPA